MTEPTITHCTQRDAGDDIHIECRMSDGQKGAFVTVSSDFPELAQRVCDFLNAKPTEELSPWIPVSERKPHENDGRVLILIADKNVAIENFVTGGHVDGFGHWWAGVPGNWLALAEHRWEVTHWKPEPTKPVSPRGT